VRHALNALGAKQTWVRRDKLRPFAESRFDLALTVGGDGTLLSVAQYLRETPALALNSAPKDSVGYFAAVKADSVADYVRDILAGHLQPAPITRLGVWLNGEPVGPPALNEVLYAHPAPAATTRFALCAPGKRSFEEQKTSGLWVATAAGSTGAIGSAGGEIFPLESDALQYVVREPYLDRRPYRYTHGRMGPRQKLRVTSRMPLSAVYFDGWVVMVPVRFGAALEFARHHAPLYLFRPR
jgi:NAD+ kinase